ncbi:MAG: cell division protein FtsQ/DivIB [Pseudomonas sp.]
MSQARRRNPPPAAAPGRGRRVFAALLSGLRLLMLVAVVTGIGFGALALHEKYDVPVAVIGVDGELKRITAQEVESTVAANLGGGFLSLDLDAICVALEEHPWVAGASARRKWPDEVVISIEEETPIARWGSGSFLNNKGMILAIGNVELPQSLPLLHGPQGLERRVMQQYRNFSQVLQTTGLVVTEFRLAPRGNWEVTFSQGLELTVGKEPVADKLQRFLLVWNRALSERVDDIAQVDIRYGNGVAVNWKEQVNTNSAESGKG